MRTLVAIALALAGVATTGAAVVRSNGPVRPASAWSVAERLGALRIDRALPPALRKEASFSLRGDHAILKVREPTGPVLLKCPLRTDVSGPGSSPRTIADTVRNRINRSTSDST